MSNINTINFNGTRYGIDSKTTQTLQTYLADVFNSLQTALNNNDMQSATAVLNQAILDLSTLA